MPRKIIAKQKLPSNLVRRIEDSAMTISTERKIVSVVGATGKHAKSFFCNVKVQVVNNRDCRCEYV